MEKISEPLRCFMDADESSESYQGKEEEWEDFTTVTEELMTFLVGNVSARDTAIFQDKERNFKLYEYWPGVEEKVRRNAGITEWMVWKFSKSTGTIFSRSLRNLNGSI
uniref:Uncharacterized protein n=1 Tax=Paramoeba aestuarina TaxID=180227 RepID=A0A7S4PAZ8_9EUKA